MIPARKAALTASPRLVAPNFLNMLRKWVSIEGDRSPRSLAKRLVVWPFATPRRTCISRDVRETGSARDRGVDSVTRRKTSGIILRGTGLSLRNAASNA